MITLWHRLKPRLLGQADPAPCKTAPVPKPDIPVAVIGDIHGRADLLNALLAKLSNGDHDAQLVFVGDFIDRGPASRQVLDRLRALTDAICICGNHEVMLLEFLDDPIEAGGRWLRNGGVETLASYNITLSRQSGHDEILAARKKLQNALSDGTEIWLRGLPRHWSTGNLLITHAGPDPAKPVAGQDDKNFLWGHNRFLRDARSDGLWVAHGHWAREKPGCENGRINVDTGAWKTGILTAALVLPDGPVRFIQTR